MNAVTHAHKVEGNSFSNSQNHWVLRTKSPNTVNRVKLREKCCFVKKIDKNALEKCSFVKKKYIIIPYFEHEAPAQLSCDHK